MRIAFYSPKAIHLEQGVAQGGDAVFLHSMFAALRGRGHEVRIVSRLDTRDVWHGRISARRLIREALGIRREMQQFSPDAWLVYDSSRTYPDLFAWWQRPKRYVLFGAHTWQSARLPKLWRWLFALAHRRSLARADKVVAVRPISAERLRARGVSEEQLCVLPHAVKIWEGIPSREEARRNLGLPQEAPVVLCVSRLTGPDQPAERKTEIVLNLLAALAPIKSNAILVLVGDGPGRPQVEEEVAKLRLEGCVRLVGSVEHDELKRFYAACDFLAFPDLLDLPRISIMEAQACGRPVVTMRTASAELAVDAGRTGLLAKDLEEFQAHMLLLASDRARCEAMGQAAREYIERFHSMDVRARQIEDMLRGSAATSEVCVAPKAGRS